MKASAKPQSSRPVAPRRAQSKQTPPLTPQEAKPPSSRNGAKPGVSSRPVAALRETPAGRAPIPERWQWHHRALSVLRDRFISECKNRLHDAAEPIEPHSMSMADSASDDFDHSLALTFLVSGQLALAEIEHALHRIELGTYGICEETKKPIPAARLRAVPWTRYRTEVESRRERNPALTTAPRLRPPGGRG